VTFTATDKAGNTATCQTEVVSIDPQAALSRAGLSGGQDHVYIDQQTTRTDVVPGCGATSCGALGLMTLMPCAAGIGALKLGLRVRRGRCPRDGQ
jgi:soluble lytic murein transglycosylase-like protein